MSPGCNRNTPLPYTDHAYLSIDTCICLVSIVYVDHYSQSRRSTLSVHTCQLIKEANLNTQVQHIHMYNTAFADHIIRGHWSYCHRHDASSCQ